MKRIIIAVVVVLLVSTWLQSQNVTQYVYTEPGLSDLNLSQAELNHANATQVAQAVRRQNEQDNGLGFNMLARIVAGNGLTDAERFASGVFALLTACGLAPLLLAVVAVVLVKLTRSEVTHV